MMFAPSFDSSNSLFAFGSLIPQIAEWTALSLLHFLWQGALLAVVIAGLLRIFGDSPSAGGEDSHTRATTRYRICCAGLLAMAAIPIFNYTWVSNNFPHANSVDSATVVDNNVANSAASTSTNVAITGLKNDDSSLLPQGEDELGEGDDNSSPTSATSLAGPSWIQSVPLRLVFWGWLIGVAALSLWHMTSWSISRRLTKNTTEVPSDLARMFAESKRKLGLSNKRIELRVSIEAWAPMVVGWFRPVILLPVSVLTALTPHEMESILIHELAHVRRHDYTMNLLQVAIETVLFFHPCVWWLSRRIRIEREYRADDVAVQFGAGPETYVHSLLRIAETCRTQPQTVTVAATGGNLADRAARLLGVASQNKRRRHRAGNALLALAIGLTVTLAGMAGVVTVRTDAAETELASDETETNDEAAAKRVKPEPWGSIRGRFVWDGVIPDLPKLRNTKDVVALGESVSDESLIVDAKTRGIKNIAVYVRDKRIAVHPDYEKTAKDLKAFNYKGLVSPRVLALRTTQKLDLVNKDPVAHSALFQPIVNEGKHLLLPANANVVVDFKVGERIPMRLTDAIHPWVRATLIVTDHPYVAITDTDGSFELKNLPAQEVELQFWHEKTGFLAARPHWTRGRKKITIRAGETFDMGDVVVPTAPFGIQAVKERPLDVGTAYVVMLDNGLVHQGVLAAINKETIRLLSDDKFIEIDRENVEGIRPRKR